MALYGMVLAVESRFSRIPWNIRPGNHACQVVCMGLSADVLPDGCTQACLAEPAQITKLPDVRPTVAPHSGFGLSNRYHQEVSVSSCGSCESWARLWQSRHTQAFAALDHELLQRAPHRWQSADFSVLAGPSSSISISDPVDAGLPRPTSPPILPGRDESRSLT